MVLIKEKVVSLLSTLFAIYITAIDASLDEIQRHLETGKQLLAKGLFADALSQYHAAIELDSENYNSLFYRATCYLAMGKSKSALSDLDRIIELKPDFTTARIQRADLLFKNGELDAAQIDYEKILSKEPDREQVKAKLALIEPTKQNIKNAYDLFDRRDLMASERFLTIAIESCPWNAELHQKRAACYEAMGQMHKAIADIRSMAKLVPDSTEAYYDISKLYYNMGDIEQSLIQIRDCLKLNPEHKKCFPFYKNLRKLEKAQKDISASIQNNDWADCINRVNRVLEMKSKVQAIEMQAKGDLCHCMSKGGNVNESLQVCGEVLSYDPENIGVLCDRAEAYLLNEQFDEAMQDFQKALNKNEDYRRAKEGLERAQKLKKQANKKDYYKILNVKRNANKKQILKAYRKLAQQWHPDNFQKKEDKEKAQKKFIDIAAAKEVLTDPEKRSRFDNGEDPLDPESQQHGEHPFYGFNPFGGGGGGGPFTFKFNFQ